jgi:hypothetical protein
MEIIPYKQLLQMWADTCGIESDTVPTLDAARFNHAFNRLIRRGWNWHRWPQLHLLEERRFRPIWMAKDYEIDTQIFHEATETYYQSNDDVTGAHEPGTSSRWVEMDPADIDAFVGYEQDGETGFSLVTEVWNANFRINPAAKRVRWEYDDRGVRIIDTLIPGTVWLQLYLRCPRLSGDTWSATETYLAGRMLYFESTTQDFEGDYWLVLDTTAAGESPITAPEKFSRSEIPEFLAEFIVQGARIAYLKGEGQLEKALAEDGNALWDLLAEERMKLLGGGAAPRRARMANI